MLVSKIRLGLVFGIFATVLIVSGFLIRYQCEASESHLTTLDLFIDNRLTNFFSAQGDPEPIWNYTYGGLDWDVAYSVTNCSDGGYAVVGYTYSFSVGGSDVWLLRTDENGNFLWNQSYGGLADEQGHCVIQCEDDGFIIVGYTASFGAGGWDIWLIRTDQDGDMLWNRTFGGPNYDQGWSVLQCEDNGFIIGGTYSSESNFWDMWLIRTDVDGMELWNHTYGGSGDDQGIQVIRCSNSGFAFAGTTDSFGSGDLDFWLIRTDDSGNVLWNHTYGTSRAEECWSITECQEGGFALAGDMWTSNFNDTEMWLIRVGIEGEPIWNNTYGHGRCRSMTECSDRGFALIGGGWVLSLTRTDGEGNIKTLNHYTVYEYTVGWSILKSDLGGFMIAGYRVNWTVIPFEYDIVLIHLPDPPFWNHLIQDHYVEFGSQFRYQLNATVPHGIDNWQIFGTESFTVNDSGIVTNSTYLEVGDHWCGVSVNDSIGNEISTDFLVHVQDTTAPSLEDFPASIIIEFDEHLHYQLMATDLSGISSWEVNDTVNFNVDNEGLLTNNTVLLSGNYSLEVSVSDVYGNIQTGLIVITVQSIITTTVSETTTTETTTTTTVTTPDPLFILVIIGTIAAAVIVILVVLVFHKRQHSEV